jgi:hypothetical protein
LDILHGKGKKRSEYGHYTPKQKIIVARYAIDIGTTKAAGHFTMKIY